MHDASVDRCTDGRGDVAAMTFAEIRKLDAGAKFGDAFRGTAVPAFEEVLEFARGKIGVYIDAKLVSLRIWWPRCGDSPWRITSSSTAAWNSTAASINWSRVFG